MDQRFHIVVRAQRAEQLCLELAQSGLVSDLYAEECQGSGTRVEGATEPAMGLLPKVIVGGVINDQSIPAILELVFTHGRSGRSGDGKVWLTKLNRSIEF